MEMDVDLLARFEVAQIHGARVPPQLQQGNGRVHQGGRSRRRLAHGDLGLHQLLRVDGAPYPVVAERESLHPTRVRLPEWYRAHGGRDSSGPDERPGSL